MTRPINIVALARRIDQQRRDPASREPVATTIPEMRAQMADWTAARRARLTAQGKSLGEQIDLDALRDGRMGRRRD